MRIALYARVSKALEQHPEGQLMALRQWAAAAGHQVIGEYVDEVSSKDFRPQKEEVLRGLRLGTLDGVAFVALDRWGRTMSELVFELEEFSNTGKSLFSLKEGIDLSTAAGRLFTHILAAMANFERDRNHERTLLGLARARALGKPIGKRGPDKVKRKPGSGRKKTPPLQTSIKYRGKGNREKHGRLFIVMPARYEVIICNECKGQIPIEELLKGKHYRKEDEIYCSNRCFWVSEYRIDCSQHGKRPHYPGSWPWACRQAFERDRYRCQKCGRVYDGNKVFIEAHHKVPISRNGNSLPENLITLCHECHMKPGMHRGTRTRSVKRLHRGNDKQLFLAED